MKWFTAGWGRDKVSLAGVRLLIQLLILMLQRLHILVSAVVLQVSETVTRRSELLTFKFIGKTATSLVFSKTRHWGLRNSFQTHILLFRLKFSFY
jgi:hypothetical protein